MSVALPVPADCTGCPCPPPSTTPVPGGSGQGVTVAVEPPGPNCTYGGLKLTSAGGVNYVCNGAPGDATSLTVETEPPGANCAAGGVKITSGSDVTYVCNGECSAPCTDGTNGVSSFTVTTADFTQPAVSATVVVEVANSSWIAVGEPMFVQVGGSYLVTAVPDSTHVTLQNLGYAGNAAPAANVTTGKIVTPSGLKGDTGAPATGSQNVVAITEEMGTGVAPAAMVFAAPGTWTQKTLNTLYDPDGVATLVANQFTLPEGRWSVNGAFCADKCSIRFRLYDVTNATMRLITTNNTNSDAGNSIMFGAIEVPAGSPMMEIEYQAIDNGGGVFGVPTGIPTELEAYSSIYFTRINFP